MFSTSPTRPTASTLALRPASAAIRPTTVPAPAMSHFMSSMPPAGLMLMPPVSKVTPLPMKAQRLRPGAFLRRSWRRPAPFHCITTMRGSLALPCATPSRAPKPSLVISFGPSTSTFRPSCDRALAAFGHLGGVQHVGRLADQVAGEEHALGHGAHRLPGGLGARRRRRPAASAWPASACPPASRWCGSGRSGSCAARRPWRPRPPAPASRPSVATLAAGSRAKACGNGAAGLLEHKRRQLVALAEARPRRPGTTRRRAPGWWSSGLSCP